MAASEQMRRKRDTKDGARQPDKAEDSSLSMPLSASFRLILTALFILRQTQAELKVDATFFLVYFYALLLRVLGFSDTAERSACAPSNDILMLVVECAESAFLKRAEAQHVRVAIVARRLLELAALAPQHNASLAIVALVRQLFNSYGAVRDLLCARYDLGAFRQLAPEFAAVDPELRSHGSAHTLETQRPTAWVWSVLSRHFHPAVRRCVVSTVRGDLHF